MKKKSLAKSNTICAVQRFLDKGQNKLFIQIFGYLFLMVFAILLLRYNDIRGTFFPSSITFGQTTGTIISSSMRGSWSRGVHYHYDIVYKYRVGSMDYESRRITFSFTGSKNFNFAQEYLDNYPVGKKVNVFYDSSNPELAVLEPTATDNKSFFILMGVFFISFFLFGFIWFMSSKKGSET